MAAAAQLLFCHVSTDIGFLTSEALQQYYRTQNTTSPSVQEQNTVPIHSAIQIPSRILITTQVTGV